MKNVMIFQPYLSNRPTSSRTVERQFRFLNKLENANVYALFDKVEADYAKTLEGSWIKPIVKTNLLGTCSQVVKDLVSKYEITDLYIARTYFTPYKIENINHLKKFDWDAEDDRYWRDWIPMLFAEQGVIVHHMIYDPLELVYDDLIDKKLYHKYSSMTNVKGTKVHNFADLGYYDINNEADFSDKKYSFCFGGTSMSDNRSKLLEDLYTLNNLHDCNVFIRTNNTNNLIDNVEYEKLTKKSLFTYTIPSQNPEYVSFTRMLLALSQGTIPLIHPDNNLDCLFGEHFEFRDSLKDFFNQLIISPERLCNYLMFNAFEELYRDYVDLLSYWHQTEYYHWLQHNV